MKTIIKATLGFSNLSLEGKVIKAQSIKDGMQASGNFAASSMPITYPSIQTIITNLHTAIVTANNGTTTKHQPQPYMCVTMVLAKPVKCVQPIKKRYCVVVIKED